MTDPCRTGRPFNSYARRSQLLLVLLLTVTSLAAADRAFAETRQAEATPVEFNIPAQSVAEALGEFARQARVQLFFISDGYENIQANAVVGIFSRHETLKRLLEGTGLTANFTPDSLIKVSPDEHSTRSAIHPSNTLSVAGAAFGDQWSAHAVDRRGDIPGSRRGAPVANDETRQSPDIEEIIVTGSHIRGVGNVGATAMTFNREDIGQTGFSTVEELFQSLPQNLDEITPDATFADGTARIAGSNVQGASSISLRGLGPGSTLVLLNGRRRPGNIYGRAFDVSAIPLSMVERVELVTGGRSAVYGSDAVAGVVNIVTRAEFDGAETQLYYGESSAGGERFNFSQTFGRDFGKGGFVLGYNYRKDQGLDVTDTGVVRAPSSLGLTPIPGLFLIQVPSEQHVGVFAGHFKVSENVELYADTHFSSDKNNRGAAYDLLGLLDLASISITDSDQYSAVGGLRFNIGKRWQVDVSGLYGVVDNTTGFASPVLPGGSITSLDFPPEFQDDDEAKLTSVSAIADGPLGEFGGGTISGAMGIDFRNESYERIRTDLPTGVGMPHEDLDRDIWSLFGEVHLPLIIGNEQRLEVSLASRYEDYSDFGDTFNLQAGIEWEPVGGLTFRGSYSEAFRAPSLSILDSSTQVSLQTLNDPADPSGMTTATTFSEFGGNPDLQPEEADTWTVGTDWKFSDRTTLSLSYFSIDYEGRIDQPSVSDSTALRDEALYPGLINRNPTPEELDAVLDRLTDSTQLFNQTGIPFDLETDDPFAVFPNIVLFDNRRNNIAIEEMKGIDVEASTVLETTSGNWSFDLNGTYYLNFERNITPAAPPIDRLNEPGKMVDLKLRGGVGWSRSAWDVNAFVNYVDSYDDTNATTPTRIDSWTTVDLTLRFDASEITDNALLTGSEVTLGISNVFDEDPPTYLSSRLGLGYDAANANPIGRFMSLRIAKEW